jgi:hypothetical protein
MQDPFVICIQDACPNQAPCQLSRERKNPVPLILCAKPMYCTWSKSPWTKINIFAFSLTISLIMNF